MRREAAALARLSADKEALLGQISHEMKTPLNGLLGTRLRDTHAAH